MDQLQTRLDALEQQMRTMNRRLRWWRGLAGGLLALAVLTWALPVGTAQDASQGGEQGLAQRVAALEDLLKHFSREGNEVFMTGANLHIVNGLGQTDCGTEEEPIPDCPNGLGNLIGVSADCVHGFERFILQNYFFLPCMARTIPPPVRHLGRFPCRAAASNSWSSSPSPYSWRRSPPRRHRGRSR